ncbi:MAG: hypothetical protein ACI9E1_001215 [Cryomorphaceae bacterium]|jgi:uncharacterized protein (DUF1800 family)
MFMRATFEKPPKAEWTRQHAAHLLKRASFSGSTIEIDECFHLGLEASVNLILAGRQPGAASAPDRKRIEPRFLAKLPSLPNQEHVSDDGMKTAYQKHQQKLFTLQMQWLQRMLDGGGPLEKMVLFWHGMLTSSYTKVQSAGFIVRQNQLFRESAFGDYRALVKRVLLDPAMVVYLDIDKNKRTKPNENFARELLEMFTLGEGKYQSALIKKLAREVVGLKLKRREDKLPFEEIDLKGMEANTGFSDQEKRLSKLIDSIFDLPVCGELLVRRLWKFYVSEDQVDEDMVKFLAYELRKSGWKVSVVLKKIFLSKAFFDKSIIGQQIKSPVQYLVQAHKEVAAATIDPQAALYTMQKLGQSLFNPPNVSGWSAGMTWINGTTLSARYELSAIMRGVMRRQNTPASMVFYELMKRNQDQGLLTMVDHFIATSLPIVKVELFIAMSKRVKSEEHLEIFILYLMCMPEYQMC